MKRHRDRDKTEETKEAKKKVLSAPSGNIQERLDFFLLKSQITSHAYQLGERWAQVCLDYNRGPVMCRSP